MMKEKKDFPSGEAWFGYLESQKTFGTRNFYKEGTKFCEEYQKGWDVGVAEIAESDGREFKDCVNCGETFEVDDLNDDGCCATCQDELDAQQEDDDSDYLCSDCNGSGEGQNPNEVCWNCRGTGTVSGH